MQLNKLNWKEHEKLGDMSTKGSIMQEYHYREAINRLPEPINPDYHQDYVRLLKKVQDSFAVAIYGVRV